jgi:hypothetical protein
LDLKKNLNAEEARSNDLLGQAGGKTSQDKNPVESLIKNLPPF